MDLVGRKILGDSGKAMQNPLQDMRLLDADLEVASKELGDLWKLLVSAIDELEQSATWLLKNAPDDGQVPGAAAFNLMMQMGTVAGGWQMARAAATASRKLSASEDHAKEFLGAKIATVHLYNDAHLAAVL